jgi:hypothetical protein
MRFSKTWFRIALATARVEVSTGTLLPVDVQQLLVFWRWEDLNDLEMKKSKSRKILGTE